VGSNLIVIAKKGEIWAQRQIHTRVMSCVDGIH